MNDVTDLDKKRRAAKADDHCSEGDPRDVLLSALDVIDDGEFEPTSLIVVMVKEEKNKGSDTRCFVSATSTTSAIGTLELGKGTIL